MFKRIIEKEVNKQVNERIAHNRNSKNLSDLFDKAQKINSSNLKEISELKEKLEASQRREKSLHKQIDDDGKEISELKEKLEASQIKEESMYKQIDGIVDNLTDENVNNLPFYTLDYSVDGQQESLINLSLHDCEELYGQIIGSLEYFKITKQEKFINEISDEYVVYGETFGNNLLYYGVFSSLNNLCNEVLRRPDLKLSNAIRFYKNGKRFAILDIGTVLFTSIDDIKEELCRLERRLDENEF